MLSITITHHLRSDMKKLFFLFLCLFAVNTVSALLIATEERRKLVDYVNKGTNLLNATLDSKQLWKEVYNPRQRDQLYEPLNTLQVLPNKPTGITFAFSRTTSLANRLSDICHLSGVREAVRAGYYFLESVEASGLADDGVITEEEADARIEAAEIRAPKLAGSIYSYTNAITFQEHRLGAHFSKEWRWGQWYAAVRSWFGMAERNYWLNKADRDNIGNLMKQVFPGMDGKTRISDFLAMNWGFGDTHAKIGYTLPIAKKWEVTAGLRTVIPTARSYVRPTKNRQIPLESNVFTGFLRQRLNEVLIEPRLGNNYHYGLGGWLEATWNRLKPYERNQLTTTAYAGWDYLLPAAEDRFFLHKEEATPGDFETDDASFRSFLSQYVIPEPVSVVVCPGIVAQAGFIANMRFEKVSMFAGYDYYYKNAEDFDRFIFKNKEEQFMLRQKDFGGTSDGAQLTSSQHQHKIQLGMAHSSTYRNVKLFEYLFRRIEATFSLHGAFSVGSKEMGDDFVIALSAGWRL